MAERDLDARPEPFLDVRTAGSTTSAAERGRISGRRRSRKEQWREAPPLRSSLRGTDVSLRLTRWHSEHWTYVTYAHGGFWISGDASALELMEKLRAGGFMVEDPPRTRSARPGRAIRLRDSRRNG